MKALVSKWKALPEWQRSAAWCVAGSAGVWLLLGTAAALGFGLGVFGGYRFGFDRAEADQ